MCVPICALMFSVKVGLCRHFSFLVYLDPNLSCILVIYISGKLEALLIEAKGMWEEAEKAYSILLEDNPLDQVSFDIFVFETAHKLRPDV